MDYKKHFLKAFIYALASSGGIGILVFLLGNFEGGMARILLTTLALAGYSLTGLSCSTLNKQRRLKSFSLIGMTTSIVGFLVTFLAIWDIFTIDMLWKPVIILMVINFALSQVSLLLLIDPRTIQIKQILWATIVSVTIVGIMFINSILHDFEHDEFYFRLLGVFSILDFLGSVATPILNRISDKDNTTANTNYKP